MATTSLGLPFVDPELESRVRSKLLETEKELARAVESDVEMVQVAARHLLDAGGKRFRPFSSYSRRSSVTRTRPASYRPPSWWS